MEQGTDWGKSRKWEATKLGPVDSWPQKLRSTISGLMQSANPTWICLRKDKMVIHNDLALKASNNPVTNEPHYCPVWPSSLEVVEMAFSKGIPVWHEYNPFTTAPAYCLTPLFGEAGEVEAVMCVFSADMPDSNRNMPIFTESGGRSPIVESKQVDTVKQLENMLHFETILELSMDGILVFDKDMRVNKWNPAMEKITGIKLSDAVGRTLYELFPFAHQAEEAALVGIASCSHDFQYYVPSSGRHGYFDGMYIPLYNGSSVVGGITLVRETTCRKYTKEALRESELKFSTVAANAPTAIIISNAAGAITYCNIAAEKQFGYKVEEMLGMAIDNILIGFGTTSYNPESPATRELTGKKKSGEEFPMEVSVATWAGRSGTMHGTLARDLTTWKKAEQVLAQARDSALKAVEMKSQFVANISHELRTPLVAVIGATELMMTTDLNNEQKDHLESITTSSNTLLQLVNDLLDFSKMELGTMTVENSPFDLAAAAVEIRNKFLPEATKKQLYLHTAIDSTLPNIVGGDGKRLRQILHNLISNAIKFTHRGDVRLEISLLEENQSTVIVRFGVKDTGVGIAQETMPHLFSVFTQGDTSLTRRFGGTGIGLALCKQLVRLMGGEIGVTSTVGAGSEFWANLPFRKITTNSSEVQDPPGSSSPPHIHPSQHSVLLVEDNVLNQKIIKACLEKIGFQTPQVVSNGAEAVQAVTQQQFDLILMDCQMPVMDGYVATAEIRRHESASNSTRTPIIALTAHGLPQDREKCIHAGMDDYIRKPLKLLELKSILAKYLPCAG